MASANDVAAFFITRAAEEDDVGLSNLKLQKLVYYAQGFHLAIHDSPLFPERIEAWTHGPVCPSVYREYKQYGSGLISTPATMPAAALSDDELGLLEEVFMVFGQFSAWKLRDMTHEESPWRNHEADAETIPVDEMKAYFKTRLN